jgi:hypothetical protein
LFRYDPLASHDFESAFLFAVHTAAVLLPVKAEFPVPANSFVPAGAPVSIYEWDSVFVRHGLTNGLQQFVLLKTAVQQRSGESVKTFGLREPGDFVHPEVEADSATLRFSKDNLSKPFLHAFLAVLVEHADIVFASINRKGIQSTEVFRIWVYVGTEEHSSNLVAFRAQIVKRVHQTWGTARMKKYSHEKGCLLSVLVV